MHNAIPLFLAALLAVGSLLSVVFTLYLLNEFQEHFGLKPLHPVPILVPGYVLEEFGMLQRD